MAASGCGEAKGGQEGKRCRHEETQAKLALSGDGLLRQLGSSWNNCFLGKLYGCMLYWELLSHCVVL